MAKQHPSASQAQKESPAKREKVKSNGSSSPSVQVVSRKVVDTEMDAKLDEYLKSLGLVRKKTPKDGACLFRAVAEQLYFTQALHMRVRNECVDFLASHSEIFLPFLSLGDSGFPSYEHYLYEMRKPDTWGDEVELQAMALRYKVNFVIYSLGMKPTIISNSNHSRLVRLCFKDGNHYDGVYTAKEFECEVFCQSIVLDIIDKALGEPQPSVRTYRNIEMECWLKGLREQHEHDRKLAQTLGDNGHQQLTGFYKKSEAGSDEFRVVQRKRKKGPSPITMQETDLESILKQIQQLEKKEQRWAKSVKRQPTAPPQPQEEFPALPGFDARQKPPTPTASSEPPSPASSAKPAWGTARNWKAVFTPPPKTAATPPPVTYPHSGDGDMDIAIDMSDEEPALPPGEPSGGFDYVQQTIPLPQEGADVPDVVLRMQFEGFPPEIYVFDGVTEELLNVFPTSE